MLCVDLLPAAVYNPAVKDVWPLSLEQRIKHYECGRLCVNFLSVAVYNSAAMEFWATPGQTKNKSFLEIYICN